MVLGLISLAATVPLTATSVLSLQDQAQQRTKDPDAAWMRNKAHLAARASQRTPEDRKPLFDRSRVVLRGGFLYVQTASCSPPNTHHTFTGYYLPYPNSNYDGLVSTIADDPPQLNWIYIDTDTNQVQHGLRVEAEQGLTGPWGADVVSKEKHVLWDGLELFLAVETDVAGLWGLYFDRQDNGLRGIVGGERRIVEVELLYQELRREAKE